MPEPQHRLGVVVVLEDGGQVDAAGRELGRRHELAAADAVPATLLDGVAVRARRRHGASSNSSPGGSGRRMTGRYDETGEFRTRGTWRDRTVTNPRRSAPAAGRGTRPDPSPVSCGRPRGRTTRPGRSRGTPGSAPTAAATPAGRCC